MTVELKFLIVFNDEFYFPLTNLESRLLERMIEINIKTVDEEDLIYSFVVIGIKE